MRTLKPPPCKRIIGRPACSRTRPGHQRTRRPAVRDARTCRERFATILLPNWVAAGRTGRDERPVRPEISRKINTRLDGQGEGGTPDSGLEDRRISISARPAWRRTEIPTLMPCGTNRLAGDARSHRVSSPKSPGAHGWIQTSGLRDRSPALCSAELRERDCEQHGGAGAGRTRILSSHYG
jgi:hypothetical protein